MTIQKIFTRDFVLCFSAQFAFTSVSFILIPTLPIYLSSLGSTEIEIGILIGAYGISSLVLRPIVGRALSVALIALTNFGYFYASVKKRRKPAAQPQIQWPLNFPSEPVYVA